MAILREIWSWIVVGEEHRPQGVTWEFAFATNWLMRLGVLAFLFFWAFLSSIRSTTVSSRRNCGWR